MGGRPRRGKKRRERRPERAPLDWRKEIIWLLLAGLFFLSLFVLVLWIENQQLKSQLRLLRSRKATELSSRGAAPQKRASGSKKKKTGKPNLKAQISAKVSSRPYLAIVLDDWGYSDRNIHYLKEIGIPLDIAILPGHRFSRQVAQVCRLYHKEVMLHLPMEPMKLSRSHWEPRTVTVEMSEEEIRGILDWALAEVPYAKGVNNHMGSRATADRRVMRIVLRELKRRGLFFLDSYSSPKSVVTEVAKEVGLPCVKRDVFIDNDLNPEYIKGQIRLGMKIARRKGYAVLIGHDRTSTLDTLLIMEPELLENVKVVFVSTLLRHRYGDRAGLSKTGTGRQAP